MALIKKKELAKMSEKDREEKIKELKIELMKGAVTTNRTNAKTREIKRTISRLYSFSKSAAKPAEELKK